MLYNIKTNHIKQYIMKQKLLTHAVKKEQPNNNSNHNTDTM